METRPLCGTRRSQDGSNFMQRIILFLAALLVSGLPAMAATGLSSILFTNLNKHFFLLDLSGTPTNMVKIPFDTTQFDTSGAIITITNIGGASTNIFITNTNYFLVGGTNVVIDTTVAGTNVTFTVNSSATNLEINATDTYLPARLNATTLTNSPIYTVNGTNVALDQTLFFGPGTTNALLRNGNDLQSTNGAATVKFRVINGSGKRAELVANSDNSSRLVAPDGYAALENTGGSIVRLNSTYFEPGTSAEVSLGGPSSGNWWNEAGFTDTYFDGGHSGTNYGRLRIKHTGSSTVIAYDSQRNGTNTYSPHAFQVGSTNILQIDSNSGASTTGIIVFENGVSNRVTIGAADSGGAGFRVLRIPN